MRVTSVLDFDGPQHDEQRQAKRNGLADKLTLEEKSRKFEDDLGPIKYLAYLASSSVTTSMKYLSSPWASSPPRCCCCWRPHDAKVEQSQLRRLRPDLHGPLV